MSRRGYVVVLASVLGVSGCAGQQSAQQIHQLKSDVGLLDQRVTQLERASLKGASTTAWPAEPSVQSVQPAAPAPIPPPAAKPPKAPAARPSKTEIQQALKAAGFYQGAIDGKIGPQTREAIKQFQQTHGLKVDGVVGRQTWEQLSIYLDQSSATGELSAAEPLK